MRACVCAHGCPKRSGGIDLLPWHDHGAGCSVTRAGGSNSVFPPLRISYQPTGGAGAAGEEGAAKNPVERVGFHGHAGATEPQGPRWAWWAVGGGALV